MARKPALTLAFLEAQPRAAARVLQDLAPENAAAFLADIPPPLAARAVADMTSWSAARCLDRMEPARIALLLAAMRAPQATHLLRLLDPERARRALEELPSSTARAYQRSLAFAPGSVGAWADHSMPVFREHDPAQQALDWLGEAGARQPTHVFVVDEEHRLSGAVALSGLLRVPRRTPLGEVMNRAPPLVGARLPLAAAAKSPGWDEYLVLPVVDERNMVLGGLARGAVRRGLEETREPAALLAERSIVGVLLVALGGALHGLVTTLVPSRERRP